MKRTSRPRHPKQVGDQPAVKPECHCLIHHPRTPEEREQVDQALEYARRVGDPVGIEIALAQLSGPCPAWNPPSY